jgi:FixJ family two-component response regulator
MSERAGPVIVVDDDDAVRNSLKFALELEGLSVRLYKGGTELLAELDLPQRGCLVVDYSMPGIDGIELVRRLRQRHIQYPAILVTSRISEGLRGQAARSGFRAVLEKPLQDSSLLDSIHCALEFTPADLRETP